MRVSSRPYTGQKPGPERLLIPMQSGTRGDMLFAALECYLRAKPNGAEDQIRKIAQKNLCLRRLIRNATTDTRFRNIQLESAIKRWRKSFREGTAPKDVQESWNRDYQSICKKKRSPSEWTAAGNKLLKDAGDRARRIILPPPVGL